MEVCRQPHAQAAILLANSHLLYPLQWGCVSQSHSWSQHCAEDKNLLPLPWFKPLGHPPCSLVAILTILSWLPWEYQITSYSVAQNNPTFCAEWWHFQLDEKSMTASELYSIIHSALRYWGRPSIYKWTRGLSKWLVSLFHLALLLNLFQLQSMWHRLGSTIF